MKIVIKQVDLNTGGSVIIIEHEIDGVKKEIPWSVAFLDSATRRKKNANGEEIMRVQYDHYEVINAYWNFLPKERQDRIFRIYQHIKNVFNDIYDFEQLTRALYPLVKDLFEAHDANELEYWVDFKSPIRMPLNDPNLLEFYDEVSNIKKPREGTYTMADYHDLVVLSVLIRIMIPVWGDYIEQVKDDVGTSFKEYRAFRLLSHAGIFESKPMEMLREYVRFNTRPDIAKPSAMYYGVSSEEFPEWMLGLVVVRKLGCLDISGEDQSVSCMKTLFNYIRHKLKNHENSFKGAISEKIFEGTRGEGENNLSTMEGYRNPQDISTATTVMFVVYMQEATSKAFRICPDMNQRTIDMSIHSVHKNKGWIPLPPQLQLMQMVMHVKKLLPAQALGYQNAEGILNVASVVQACLWHRGYKALAALVSAKPAPKTGMMMAGGSTHRARPKDQTEELNRLFPYAGRKTARASQEDQPNVARQQIDSIEKMFSEHNWILTLPKEWVMEVNKGEYNRRYSVPTDIKIMLADLAIAIAKRSF